ncbi:GNAT family N-acetyltransferase [Clostridium frigidicarnis]|uniref:Protein N-acetyltransferase, RimJ/RimL family n=1 Tax=Clostridium frigidicarnis TaxID=84698 RepID=A0A1I0ZJX6_9CLOT|nr:GNAT family N-acetyltransferase [Clostridium frigidicarnis]SFB25954.1 Protein N-acetyltransferase, RimJ/RimL family [Clostridium frigidicarnis]
MNLKNIHTNRLILIPITLEITKSLINGSSKEIEKLGIKCDKKWPTKDTMDILPIINNSLEKSKISTGFETWMIVDKNNKRIIGDIGFHGRPNENGEVEVGFGLVEHERGKGFGSESLNAIMDWLNFQESVKVINAECLISNKPSARILKKAGLKEVNRDNELIYWEFIKSVC